MTSGRAAPADFAAAEAAFEPLPVDLAHLFDRDSPPSSLEGHGPGERAGESEDEAA